MRPWAPGNYIRNTGGDVLRVLIGFNNGIYEQNDISTWIASNPKDILAANLGLAAEDVEGLPQETVFMTQPKA